MASATLQRIAVTVLALVATSRDAHADGDRVPDASLRAVKDRVVRVEIDGAPAVEGRLLGFEEAWVTIARSISNEVVSIPRANVLRIFTVAGPILAAAPMPPLAVTNAPTETVATGPTEKLRVLGVHTSLLGTVAVDVDYRFLHGFASTNLLLPLLTASGDGTWIAAAIGAGVSMPFGKTNRWKLDVFGEALPFHTTSFYTYVGFGVGAGFHYTAASGFSLGFTFPLVGFSTRLGSSPTGYDASFRYNDSIGYYYLAGAAGMPLLTMGYRFSTNCPRPE